MADKNKSYLGDGLYYEFDGYHIRLWTQQGMEAYLDPQVLQAFIGAVERSHGLVISVTRKEKENEHE